MATALEQSFADLVQKHELSSLTINFFAVRDDGGAPFFAVYPKWTNGDHEQGIGPTIGEAFASAYKCRAQRKVVPTDPLPVEA